MEAIALNYPALSEVIFAHFTIENVMLLCIAFIMGLLPFAVSIRFGDERLARKSVIAVFQVVCISILVEDIAYFVALGKLIVPGDWTAQILGGFTLPFGSIFVPSWYLAMILAIGFLQWIISRIK